MCPWFTARFVLPCVLGSLRGVCCMCVLGLLRVVLPCVLALAPLGLEVRGGLARRRDREEAREPVNGGRAVARVAARARKVLHGQEAVVAVHRPALSLVRPLPRRVLVLVPRRCPAAPGTSPGLPPGPSPGRAARAAAAPTRAGPCGGVVVRLPAPSPGVAEEGAVTREPGKRGGK